jgi:hypothetical protein
MKDSHDIGKVICPWCAAAHDSALNVGVDVTPPDDGDVNICINCVRISIYDEKVQGGLRSPTVEELHEAMMQPEVVFAMWAARRSHYQVKRASN